MGKGQGRYDFEDLEDAQLDEYRFQIELEVWVLFAFSSISVAVMADNIGLTI